MNYLPRWKRMLIITCSAVALISHRSFSAAISGIVVERGDDNAPIPGVLVASGYGLHRTMTDSAGRFSLDAPRIAALRSSPRTASPTLTVRWNVRQRIFDVSAAREIAAVFVHRLDGSMVFGKYRNPGRSLIDLPPTAPGVYLVKFTRGDNSSFVRKLLNVNQPGAVAISAPSRRQPTAATAALDSVFSLLFRHDDYYPRDRTLFEPAESLVVALNPDPRSFVFDQAKVHAYRFTLSREDSLSMERNALAEEFTPAQFTFDSTLFGNVGLRYKGSKYYSMPRCFDEEGNRSAFPDCRNVSLKIKFNKYDDARFYEMKRLNLHSMPYDDGKMREMIAYALFREAGIHTCRTAFAKVYVNNVFRGLFTAVEEVDGRFTKSRWPSYGDGNLYKEAWPLQLTGKYYRDALKTNDDPEDSAVVSRMIAFSRAIRTATPETFVTAISPFMDLNYWLRYIAVDRAIHNSDGIMTWYTGDAWMTNHNYYFYEEENPGGRFWLIPWDLNSTLYPSDPMVDDYGLPEWNVVPENCDPVTVWGGDLATPPNCDKLTGLTAATLWNDFSALGKQFLADILTPERLKNRIARLASLIDPVMTDEPTITHDDWLKAIDVMKVDMDPLCNDFDDHVNNRIPVVDTTGFFTPFPADSGLRVDRVNNFEFDPAESIDSWTNVNISDGSTTSLSLDTLAPLWGMADMLCSFVFHPADTATPYAEWAYLGFSFADPLDCSELKGLRISLRGDTPRSCWIHLASDVYERNGVDDSYGWFITIGIKNKQFTLTVDRIGYPTWADSGNPDLLDSMLTEVKGIGLNPNPRFDDFGRLSVVPDTGFIRIDNIVFDF
ncbi:MAG: CotH kinase family protein [Chitinispirillaceae bacterium]|nr:CotH kinase family protein [Chitinispirillaceae bacterium]